MAVVYPFFMFKIMSPDDLIKIGFVDNTYIKIFPMFSYALGRNRFISIHSVGTPNEMVYLTEEENKEVKALFVFSNYDYDGYLTIEKLLNLIKLFDNDRLD